MPDGCWRLFAPAQQTPQASAVGSRVSGDPARPRLVYPLTTLELPERPADVAVLRRIVGLMSGGAPAARRSLP